VPRSFATDVLVVFRGFGAEFVGGFVAFGRFELSGILSAIIAPFCSK
jgi:hypothetical protein